MSELKNIYVKLPVMTCGDISDIQNITVSLIVHLLSASSGTEYSCMFP